MITADVYVNDNGSKPVCAVMDTWGFLQANAPNLRKKKSVFYITAYLFVDKIVLLHVLNNSHCFGLLASSWFTLLWLTITTNKQVVVSVASRHRRKQCTCLVKNGMQVLVEIIPKIMLRFLYRQCGLFSFLQREMTPKIPFFLFKMRGTTSTDVDNPSL